MKETQEYKVLARKYRPKTFSDLIGYHLFDGVRLGVSDCCTSDRLGGEPHTARSVCCVAVEEPLLPVRPGAGCRTRCDRRGYIVRTCCGDCPLYFARGRESMNGPERSLRYQCETPGDIHQQFERRCHRRTQREQ